MFLRVVRATVSKGVKRDYVRVVEAYRDAAGKTQHRTVINLGRRDLLAAHLDFDKLRRLLHGDAVAPDGMFEEAEHAVRARPVVIAMAVIFAEDAGGAYEGKYVIQTEEPDLSARDAVRLYKGLSEVERAFANLKDVIDMRPIYHRSDHRVEAHIFVAALAFLLHRAIEKKLKAAGLDLSATEALNALKSVRVVDIDLGDRTTHRCVTRGTQRAAAVLRALAITDLDPPHSPATRRHHHVVTKRHTCLRKINRLSGK